MKYAPSKKDLEHYEKGVIQFDFLCIIGDGLIRALVIGSPELEWGVLSGVRKNKESVLFPFLYFSVHRLNCFTQTH